MSHRTRSLWTVAAAALLVLGACSSDGVVQPAGQKGTIQLVRMDSCDAFGDWVKDEASRRVGAYGLEGDVGGMAVPDVAVAERSDGDVMAAPASESTSSDAGAANAFDESATGTNNQESDVDEADLVKTDGRRVIVAHGNRLQVFSLVEGAPYLDAAVDLGDVNASRLFLVGDRVYVLGDGGYGGGPIPMDDMGTPAVAESRSGDIDPAERSVAPMSGSTVVEVDLSTEPTVVGQVSLEGTITDGRMADGTVRLVVQSQTIDQMGFVYPQSSSSERSAARTNLDIVESSDPSDWIPKMQSDGGDIEPLVECSNLSHPQEFAGFGTLSVVTISDGLDSLTATGVTADAQAVYASTDTLYVATTRWGGFESGGGDAHVDIHSFDTPGSDPAVYAASGRVSGTLLNQYSLSEWDGHLRVATTTIAAFDCGPNEDCAMPESDNGISVLQRDGDSLNEVGRVDGLGIGEQIKSVRFLDRTAYVVTFRQTDPFYVVDLADPTSPTVLGELKVPGFSSYLHPVGDGLVLGIGSDASDTGRVTGAKVSLYDATDPLNPTELSNWTDPSWSFMVDYDPKAFHFDAAANTVYLPASATYNGGFEEDIASGAGDGTEFFENSNTVLVFSLDGRTITAAGQIAHVEQTPSPQPRPVDPPDESTTTTTVADSTTTTSSTPTTSTTTPGTRPTEPPTTTTAAPEQTDAGVGSSAVDPDGPVVSEPSVFDEEPYYGYAPTITRVFVVGAQVVTVSDAGIATHDVAGLTLRGFAPFG